jgi:peptidoglycan/LPS O-acetylase OafA/YrhL
LRRDIQFLRGIAVLVVVLYHSNLGLLQQGYLGVDVFFVLSGFLITSIILKELDSNSFQFSVFYLRRAKRLLPALYSTLFFTTLLCFIVLTQQQL